MAHVLTLSWPRKLHVCKGLASNELFVLQADLVDKLASLCAILFGVIHEDNSTDKFCFYR